MYEVKGDRGQVNPQIEIVRLVIAINDDLCQGIAYYELFEPSSLSEPLIERVNQHLIHEGFNVVSEALELGVITTLCRIWDKTRGTASVTDVMSRLRRNPGVVSDQTAFAQWQAVSRVLKNPSTSRYCAVSAMSVWPTGTIQTYLTHEARVTSAASYAVMRALSWKTPSP
jgi:hypothetical protein